MIKNKYSKRLGFQVDSNIEPIVYYLNKNGVKTFMSCGHGNPNRIILKNKVAYNKAKRVLNKINVPKSANLKIYRDPKSYVIKGKRKGKPIKNSPMLNMIEFKRGYAHKITKNIREVDTAV